MLRQRGAHMRAVGSVGEALAEFEESCPDVLVSDISMPAEDGYVLIERVRALAGFQRHLAKPIEPGQLIGVLASFRPDR